MVYARGSTRPKPRHSQATKWAAPVAGWISNRALATPDGVEGPGAAVLDNFFPRSTGVRLRRGKLLYATLEDDTLPVTALFTYRNGAQEQLFGANANTIYDLTEVAQAESYSLVDSNGDFIVTENNDVIGSESTEGLDIVGGYTGGEWSVVQFATTGGVFLVGVNGADAGFIYDGTRFYPNVEGGTSSIGYDAGTSAFVEGAALTGGTSGATATIWRVDGDETSGTLYVNNIAGTFVDDEPLTDGGGGAATADGVTAIEMPGMDFGDLDSSDMVAVWSYKSRLYFAEKDSLNVWYLDVDSIGGTATAFPMEGLFSRGGYIMFGERWSLEGGAEGGLSDQMILVSSEGEVAVFQGGNPNDANDWRTVGVYRIGPPLGRNAYFRGGGDIAIATTVGLVPLSKAISLDITALSIATVSYRIADAWSDAVAERGASDWQAYLWPEGKMALISPPQTAGEPVLFVTNTETGAWARFTGWRVLCMEVFRGQLYFGSPNGYVYLANVSGLDHGTPYSGAVVPLFSELGAIASRKIGKVGRAITRSSTEVNGKLSLLTDYNENLPTNPSSPAQISTSNWDQAIWGAGKWGDVEPSFVTQEWRSLGGMGYAFAPCYQVTSGSPAPIDVELVSIETLHSTAEMVT